MAIDNQFGKGIGVAAGFDLGAQKPLDARIAVNTIAERDAHVENNRAYEGMIVFVDETKKNYQLINGAWQELAKAEQDRLDALEAMLNGGEGVEGANGVLGALQDAIDEVNDRLEAGGDIAEKISQNEADIDALDEKIGVKAEFDDEGNQTAPATGIHKYIDEQDAQLRDEIDAALEEAEGLVAGEKSRAEGQEAAIRQELANEKAALQAEIDADVKAEADRAKAEEADIRADFAAADAALKAELQKEIDDDVAAEAGLREAADNKIREDFAAADNLLDQKIDREIQNREAAIKNLVDGDIADLKGFKDGHSHEQMEEDIAQLKEDVDAVEAEIGEKAAEGKAATGMYKYIDDKFAAQNNDIQGAVNNLNGLVSAEEAARKAKDQEIIGMINDLQADVDQNELDCDAAVAAEKVRAEAAEKALDDKIVQEIQDRKDAVSGEANAREVADNALDERLKAVEEMVGLESGEEGESLSDRVAANEAKLAGLEEGCDTVQAAIDKAEADAKAHAEQKIADLVDSAPDAMNTLNELAKAINDNQGVYDAYVAEHATAMANMKKELQDEIDADVLVEKERAEGVEAAIRQELADAIEQEVQDRDAAIKVEADRAKAAEEGIQEQINKGLKTAAYDGDQEYDDLAPLAQ